MSICVNDFEMGFIMINNVKPKWYIGIGALIITVVFFIFGAFPIQLRFGMWGLAITEIGILIIALVPMLLFKWKLRDVMPVKKITVRQLSAALLFFITTYILVNTVSLTTMYLFPDYARLSAGMTDFYSTVPFVVSVIIMSIFPGICEEVLHRGLIQHTLKDIKNPMILMLVMAFLFGVFHLDIYRFLPTAIIGFVLTYIMIKTENFLLPVIYHTVNNAVSTLLSYGSDATADISLPIESVGVFLILSALSPFLIYMGVKMFNTEKLKKKAIITVIVSTLVLLSSGIGILVPALTRTPVTNFSFTENVNNETPPSVHGNIRIENEGMYDLHVSMTDKTHTVRTTVRVEHEDGEIMWETGGYDMFAKKPTLLRTGIYNIIFIYETQSESIIPVEISFAIR